MGTRSRITHIILGVVIGATGTWLVVPRESSVEMHSGNRTHGAELFRQTCVRAYEYLRDFPASGHVTDEVAFHVANVAQLCAGSSQSAGDANVPGGYPSDPMDPVHDAQLKREARLRALEAFYRGLGKAKRVNEWAEVLERYEDVPADPPYP